MDLQNKNIIIFDGICNLCSGWFQFLLKVDKKQKFSFSTLQSFGGQQLISEHFPYQTYYNTIIYIKQNKIYTYSDAIFEILFDLGGIWRIFQIFKLLPHNFRDLLYKKLAQNRYRIFGIRKQCLIPDKNLEKRFIE